MRSVTISLIACSLALLGEASPVGPQIAGRGSKLQFVGVNEAGADFGSNVPGTYGKDYTWPDLSTIATWTSRGFNIFRVPFLMERMTPGSLSAGFDTHYLGNLTATVNAMTSAGAHVLIDAHNYGRFNGQVITDTNAFGKWWGRLASHFKYNSKVIFDVNNEFYDMPGKLVAQLNQAAIDNIRSAGAKTQYIAVEGNAYTGAWTWTTAKGTDGLTNAQTMGGLTDPSNLILYEMHQYLDENGSGKFSTCVSSTIGSQRLAEATAWLRQNKKLGLIGEFAGAVNSVCEAAIKDMLSYMDSNDDVWKGAVWWAAGPWWGSYLFSVEPNGGTAYSTYEPILWAAQ